MDLTRLIGKGEVNEWHVAYNLKAEYGGYIADTMGNRFHVSEDDALKLSELLNGLLDALGDMAIAREDGDPAYYLRCNAYDELDKLGQIVSEETE